MVISSPSRILVNISLDAELSKELLSWAIGLAGQPNDTIVALHIIVVSNEYTRFSKTGFRQAKAFVISMLGEFAEVCRSKQVNLEARVIGSSSIERGLIAEATSIGASYLVVGGMRNQNQSQRSSLGIMRYCLKNAPKNCSVVAIGIGRQHQNHLDTDISSSEVSSQSSSSWSYMDGRAAKDALPIKKSLASIIMEDYSSRNKLSHLNSLSRSSSEKLSPRDVLTGPEGRPRSIEDDCYSIGDSSVADSTHVLKYQGRSNIWKHLSPIRHFFPLLRSSFEKRARRRNESFSDKENEQPSWRCFKYDEISNATNNFHPDNIVGRGGFSEVFKGDMSDGRRIAVKRLAKDNTDENKQKEFLIELGILGHVSHPNTAYLVGCCFENGLHLIFDYSPNGNLSSALHSKTCKALQWADRYKIIIGIARGLHYLHKGCKRRIIHRDIKASNVLLGLDFEPLITDFGLAKWLPKQLTHHSVIPVEGTFGYLAPEYFMHGIVDEKTDVFAFGVLLLEIITGRRPIDISKQSLMYWAKPLIESENIAELADPRLEGNYDVDQMHRTVVTASYCIRQSSLWRPSMSEVLQLLIDGHDSKFAQSWRMPKSKGDAVVDYTLDLDSCFSTTQIFKDYV